MKMPDKKCWQPYFTKKILERGRDYYETDAVDKLVYDADKNSVTAEVYGSKVYKVEITFDDDRSGVILTRCTCPYAKDGTRCKHMAAVLFAFEDHADFPDEEGEHKKITLEETVEKLSEKEAKALLLEYAEENPALRDRLILKCCDKISPAQKRVWERELQKISYAATGGYDYVDYYHAEDYFYELSVFLEKRLPALIENGLLEDAFELLCMTYEEAYSNDVDDSDGGYADFDCCCFDWWEELHDAADLGLKREMFAWFNSKKDENLFYFVLENFPEREFLEQKLALLDKKLAGEADDSYYIENVIAQKSAVMSQMKLPPEEIKAFRDQYRMLHGIRKQEIDEALAEEKYAEAIDLIKESKRIDENTGWLYKWSEMLIDLYEKTGKRDELGEELLFYVFNCRQDDMEYVMRLKNLLTHDEWTAVRSALLLSDSMSGRKCELLSAEKMYEDLLDELVKEGSASSFMTYEKELKKQLPDETRAAFAFLLDRMMKNAASRNTYAEAAQYLRRLKTHTGGKALADDMAKRWAKEFPRRSAMKEELRDAGFDV